MKTKTFIISICLILVFSIFLFSAKSIYKTVKKDIIQQEVNTIKSSQNNHIYYMNAQWGYFSNRTQTLNPQSTQMIFLGNSLKEKLLQGYKLDFSH